MKRRYLLLTVMILMFPSLQASEPADGIVTGGIIYTLPEWFKSSFLKFEDEIDEAKQEGKHVIAFLHLDECPYCARMLEENFIEGDSKEFMENNFDVIGVDVRGALEVTWIDGETYTERELADHLKAIATPTIIFLDLDGRKVLQLNGYRDPRAFRYALDYVQGKQYSKVSFSDYLNAQEKPVVYALRAHPQLQNASYFSGYDKPLAILFESQHCAECDRFHEKTLNHPDVLAALKGFLFVRFDTESDQKIVDLDGHITTAKQWVKDLGLTFRPSIVLFNSGKELFRADGILYHHHLSEALTYVERGYAEYESIDEFKEAYREALMSSGRNIDFSE